MTYQEQLTLHIKELTYEANARREFENKKNTYYNSILSAMRNSGLDLENSKWEAEWFNYGYYNHVIRLTDQKGKEYIAIASRNREDAYEKTKKDYKSIREIQAQREEFERKVEEETGSTFDFDTRVVENIGYSDNPDNEIFVMINKPAGSALSDQLYKYWEDRTPVQSGEFNLQFLKRSQDQVFMPYFLVNNASTPEDHYLHPDKSNEDPFNLSESLQKNSIISLFYVWMLTGKHPEGYNPNAGDGVVLSHPTLSNAQVELITIREGLNDKEQTLNEFISWLEKLQASSLGTTDTRGKAPGIYEYYRGDQVDILTGEEMPYFEPKIIHEAIEEGIQVLLNVDYKEPLLEFINSRNFEVTHNELQAKYIQARKDRIKEVEDARKEVKDTKEDLRNP